MTFEEVYRLSVNGVPSMREALKHRCTYQGVTWQHKVDRMSDEQIIAVYMRLRSQNKVDK